MRKAIMGGLLATAIGISGLTAQAIGQGPESEKQPWEASDADSSAKCAAITPAALGATTATGKWVAADEAKHMPAYCEVSANLSPVAGSNIGVVYRLPAAWNGKMLGLGGGGWAGNITLGSATPGLRAGYATAQTNGGHASTSPWDTDWTAAPEAVTDFAFRAINRMTVAGKALVKSYYGKAQDRAYFHGCSTGGRMALMEAQRFPDDYDAIIAEAPVYSLQVQTSAVLRGNVIAAGGGFTPDQMKLINTSVLQACDAKDGLADGVIANPRQCSWSPKALACPAGQAASATCLAPKQVATLETLYAGIKAPDGSWAMLPLNKGGEAGWGMFIKIDGSGTDQASGGGMPGLSPLLFGSRKVDFNAFTANKDVPEARRSAFAKAYEATNPNLAPFFAHGGKLLLWHGQSDPGPSPVATVEYYEQVLKANPSARGSVALFLAPGVGHCRGGPGPDIVDNLSALDRWKEIDIAPERIIARRADNTQTRPLCPWPKVARYKGRGDANLPNSYVCEAPKS